MKFEILTVGKIQDKNYRVLIEEYLQRCGGRISTELVHCRNDEEMEKRIQGREWVVALDERGKVQSSIEFSDWLSKLMRQGLNRVTVCLGGASGLSRKVVENSREQLSVSGYTLNHQLALLVIAEQLYRGLTILFGEPYHKK